ncbi:MAG TPA: protein kinase [Bryobacteraceae bacterium]|jgi:serine/threonine-protein kinase|nr:protein kinase [Bryobacteraceae bacterium]
MTGEFIGRYALLPKIGQGGMGEVYLAQDTVLERKVAIKLLSNVDEADPVARRRFLREAKAAASLDHPFICKVYEAGEFQGRVFIAMEFVDGETLEARLMRERPRIGEAIHIFKEIAEALSTAHLSGLIHRDLKPSNIMIGASGHVKVLDFGLAQRILNSADQTLTAGSMMAGTLAYMSPEQVSGKLLDQRSDIFSLGVIWYEMLTGMHPFRRPTPLQTAMAILNEEPTPANHYLSGVPSNVHLALSRMLTKTVEDRYAHVDEILQDLREENALTVTPSEHARSGLVSIAVLPFVNMTSDPEQEYFSDGMTEDIIREVSRIPGVKVLARTSIMRFRNSQKETAQIGQELGVTNLLEGSVRRSGNRVRISTALVDVETTMQTWSDVYDRDLTDVLKIQSEVSSQIANALSMTLTNTPSRSARQRAFNIDAYQSYLKGMYLLNKLAPDSVEKSIRFFEEALTFDAADARAYAGISYANCMLGHFDFVPPRIAFPRAKAAALRAFELDPRLVETHICMGLTQMFHDWDWAGAKTSFRQALALNANSADAHLYYSWCLLMTQEIEIAVEEARHALDLDPLSPTARTNLAHCLADAGQFEESMALSLRTIELDPYYGPAYVILGFALLGAGHREQAFEYLERWSWRKTIKGLSYGFAGRKQEALATIDELLSPDSQEPVRPSEIGLIYFMAGDLDSARVWFDRAFEEHDYMLLLHTCGRWLPNREHELLTSQLERMGIV